MLFFSFQFYYGEQELYDQKKLFKKIAVIAWDMTVGEWAGDFVLGWESYQLPTLELV